MTQAAKDTFPIAQPDRARPVPRPRRKRDHALAAIVLASLAIHASVLLPMLFTAKTAAPPSVETPVEVIQEPPSEPKKEPRNSGKDAAKEAQEKVEQTEKAKAEKAKAEQAKADQAKAEAEKAKAEQAKAEAEKAKAEQAKEQAKPKSPERKVAKTEPKPQPQKAAPKPTETQADVAARMRSLLGLPPQSLDPTALPGESANGTEGATYEQLVMSRLTKAVSMDRHPGRPGFATVTFVLGERGEVESVALNRPSGDPLLDSEATEVVKRAAPFPVPPAGAKRTFTVTLQSRPVM